MKLFLISSILAAVLLATVAAQDECPEDFQARVAVAREECKASRIARQADRRPGGHGGHPGFQCLIEKLKDDPFVAEVQSACPVEEDQAQGLRCFFTEMKQRCPDLMPHKNGGHGHGGPSSA